MPSEPKKHAFRRVDSGGDVCRWCGDPYQPGHIQDNTGDAMPSEPTSEELRAAEVQVHVQGLIDHEVAKATAQQRAGWPAGEVLVRDLLRALGEYDGARPESPQSVWEGALAKVRDLAQQRVRYEAAMKAGQELRAMCADWPLGNGPADHWDKALAAIREERPDARV